MQKLIDVQEAKEFASTFLADPILKMAVNAVLDNAPAVTDTNVGGKWIPVTERLPGGECIALGYQNEMLIGYIGDSEYSDTGYAAESDGEHLSDVTHWMPLPEPPKGD